MGTALLNRECIRDGCHRYIRARPSVRDKRRGGGCLRPRGFGGGSCSTAFRISPAAWDHGVAEVVERQHRSFHIRAHASFEPQPATLALPLARSAHAGRKTSRNGLSNDLPQPSSRLPEPPASCLLRNHALQNPPTLNDRLAGQSR